MTKRIENHSGGSPDIRPESGLGANAYFNSLPAHVQEMILARRESIRSESAPYSPADLPPPRGG